MRSFLIALSAAGALAAATAVPASAADGCGIDGWGRYYCLPGAQPGVPYYSGPVYGGGNYYGRPNYYGNGPYYGGGRYYRRDYDPGAAIAAGIVGAAAAAIASGARHQYRGKKRYRHR
ncbi:MAG: hypothetical protein AB7K04_05505 [Pseudorhodoplanes sp.]